MGVTLVQQHNLLSINLKDYCKIDGTSDDSVGFTTAYTLASSLGYRLFHPGGTLLKGNDTLLANVPIIGVPGKSIIKLKNSANTDLFSCNTSNINLSSASLSGSNTAVVGASISGITLDGNKANQSSGTSYPLRVYAYAFTLRDVEVLNGYTGGILSDYNGTPDPASPSISVINHWSHVEIHDNNGIGLQVGGPTDAQWDSVNSYKNGSHNYHLAPNAVGCVLSQCHGWETPHSVNAVSFLCEAGGTKLTNCQIEGSDVLQVAFIGNDCEFHGGEIFPGYNGNTAVGLQIGQLSGRTPYPGQILQSAGVTTAVQVAGTMINTKFDNNVGGAIDYQNELYSDITALIWTNGGGVLVSGRQPNYKDRIFHNVNGVTSDGSMNKSNRFAYGGPGFNMFTLLGDNGTPILNADGTDNILAIANSTQVNGYSDYYSTQTYNLNTANGNMQLWGSLKVQNATTFYSGNGAPSNGLGSDGDYYFRTGAPTTANQRIYIKSSGTWTGIV